MSSLTGSLAVLRDTDTLGNELEASPPIIYPIKGMNRDMVFSTGLLRRVETPVKFLWGTDDPMGGADVARPLTARMPNAELDLIEGAGHAPWMDDPVSAAQVVGEFIG